LVINADTVIKDVRFYGPGEITGINPRQIVRTEPRHRTPDFEPNYFPAVEFDRPDFPWLFTPAKGNAEGRLRPWLCLVVVRKQTGVALHPAVTKPLPVLEIKFPARPADELPDLAESWAWAHAQVTGSERAKLKDTLANSPARSVSRLLCPRRLDPLTEYLACVVPTFEVGRKAGLDQPILPLDETRLRVAWGSGPQSPKQVELPVYYHWEFRTGAGEDFEELVRRLEARQMPPEVGKRPMDISRPGFKFQPTPDVPAVLGLEGALRVVKTGPDNWLDGSRLPFQSELKGLINMPWQIATKDGNQEPVVGPPLYGCWLTTVHEVAKTDPPSPEPPGVWPPPFWLDELNLDPRNRATAGAGTEVVRKEQESLMASAWEQLGDIEKINQRMRQAQLGRAVNNVYHAKTFSRFSEQTFLKIVAPAHSRIVLADKTRLSQKLESVVPSSAVSAPLRRLTRPRGAVNRQFARAGKPGVGFMLFNRAPGQPLPTKLGQTLWMEDDPPKGANLTGKPGPEETWIMLTKPIGLLPKPYTGLSYHQSFSGDGHGEHSFRDTPNPFPIGVGDRLFVYVLLTNPLMRPHELMLHWHTKEEGWEHRAYWGDDAILEGKNGTVSRQRIGDLPADGVWVRLEVAAADVGLEGKTVDGVCFSHFRLVVSWDRIGQYGPHHKGPITITRVSNMLPAGLESVLNPGPPPKWEPITADMVQAHNSFRRENILPDKLRTLTVASASRAFLEAAKVHQKYLTSLFEEPKPSSVVVPATPKKGAVLKPGDIKKDALVSLNPERTIGARALTNVTISSQRLRTDDPLHPIMDAPTFPQPMYESLRDLSPAFLFPGLEQVPPDSVQLLETNARFIESFMVGLNVEMSRELLWRGYPTDQRGTYFQHFWDAPDDDKKLGPDVPPIHLWGRGKLGDNATGAAAGDKLVLLIRGELLRRYPNTVIYAVQAVGNGNQPELPDPMKEIHPLFRGTLEPDVTFLGFNLTADVVRKAPGYFFVLQQQPTEPRFGLDAAPFSRQVGKPEKLPVLKSWNELNWGHLAKNQTELNALAHVPVKMEDKLKPTDEEVQGEWGRNSSHMAYITKQRLVRIAIHASQMLPAADVSDPRK
jgi:hypothetical protein